MTNSSVVVDRAGLWDAEALSDVATVTFPLACPPQATPADIEAFLTEMLSGDRFGEYLSDPDRTVLKAVDGDEIVGYAMLVAGRPTDPDIDAQVSPGAVVELSKMYVLPGHQGTGVSTALMDAAVDTARAGGADAVWLGVNQDNERAQRFYGKHGFVRVGTKTMTVGSRVLDDFVFERTL
ncbi:GNAT family N-acetyltransferase [Nocardia caishijiensis]|uniref:Acetyltransferase (GNAT) family protein n=1 Tax=Nocardia caishijiensis TaxID=184756 RepID=A0ABQ6YP63_9NOCA|nr:GNAT family N-acetyltransferase [Nocardia caishijiensis]KAF0847570.1 acetyltransferase (GNAT) family protein [Nocardia caishijiensis]